MGTAPEMTALQLIKECIATSKVNVTEHQFIYKSWKLFGQPLLKFRNPLKKDIPCEAFINCRATPAGGIRGSIDFIGFHRVIGAFDWPKFGIKDSQGKIVGYISGRPDGPAQPQPLDPKSGPLPHFIIGADDLRQIETWIDEGVPIEVEGAIECETGEQATGINLIASFNPAITRKRICLCAHYDSVYSSPGANDNASSVAALLAIADMMTEDHELPLDLVFFTGEEWGNLGSRAYIKDLVQNGKDDTIQCVINLDAISEGSDLQVWVGPEMFEQQLKRAIDQFEYPEKERVTYYFPPPVSGDHISFYEAGIPSCMFFGGATEKYHISDDTYQPDKVNRILFITEMVWHLTHLLAKQEVSRGTWRTDDIPN